MKPTVYVTQDVLVRGPGGSYERRYDHSSALSFGNLKYVVNFSQTQAPPYILVETLRNALSSFTQDDYLLPVGDPVIMSLATHFALEASGGRVQILRWDRVTQAYQPVHFDVKRRTK